MTLGGIGRREVVTIDVTASLEVARVKMLALGLSCLVVVERDQPVGMLSRTDILRSVVPGVGSWGHVRDAMTPLIASLPESTTLPDAARQMVDSHIHRVVVTFEEGPPGIASLTDIARALADATELGPAPAGLQIMASAKVAPPMRTLFLESYQRVMAQEDAFIEAFRERFLGRSPFVAVRFEELPDERVRAVLRSSVRLVHAAIKDVRGGRARLRAEGRSHGREQRNVDPKLHALWADSLVGTMRDFDPEHDIQVEVAWRVVLGHVVRVMSRNF